jgi:hypothetical protein
MVSKILCSMWQLCLIALIHMKARKLYFIHSPFKTITVNFPCLLLFYSQSDTFLCYLFSYINSRECTLEVHFTIRNMFIDFLFICTKLWNKVFWGVIPSSQGCTIFSNGKESVMLDLCDAEWIANLS